MKILLFLYALSIVIFLISYFICISQIYKKLNKEYDLPKRKTFIPTFSLNLILKIIVIGIIPVWNLIMAYTFIHSAKLRENAFEEIKKEYKEKLNEWKR